MEFKGVLFQSNRGVLFPRVWILTPRIPELWGGGKGGSRKGEKGTILANTVKPPSLLKKKKKKKKKIERGMCE
ncbi:hypothetical protein ACJ1_44920 [Pantoea sp. QMID1]|nr:hypothetical protein ACJ1_44920 [Pantoea sp. QMID1]